MKKTKLIAAAVALVMAGGAINTFPQFRTDNALTAYAATTYENYTEDGIKYEVFSDHAAVIGHEKSKSSLTGVLEIPAEVKGVPITEIRKASPYSANPKYPFDGYEHLSGLVISDSVTKIGMYSFRSCKGLVNVKFGNSVEEIEMYSFANCYKIKKLELPSSLKTIGQNAFESCQTITELTIPDSVTKMGNACFASCTGLTNAAIGRGVTVIPGSAFSGCNKLTDIEFKGNLTEIKGYAFYSCGFESFTIPDTVTVTGNNALGHCGNLVSADMGSGLETIEAHAFGNCENLKNIKFSPKLSAINAYAFEQCKSPENVKLPSSVLSIGDDAFQYCKNLKSVTIPNKDCIISNYNDTLGGYTEQTVIYGVKGSYAEEHAAKIGYVFKQIADAAATTTTTTTSTTTSTTTTTAPAATQPVRYDLGDVNGDGRLNAVDASSVLAYYSMISTNREGNYTESQKKAADVNNDGFINAVDASIILAYYAYTSTGGAMGFAEFLAHPPVTTPEAAMTSTTTTTTTTTTSTTTSTTSTAATTTTRPVVTYKSRLGDVNGDDIVDVEDAVFITGYVNGDEKNWAEYYNKNKAPGSKLSAEQALENADTFRPSDKREKTIDDAKAIMGYINGDYILPIKEF